jgi:N-methylhydantoinase A
VVTVQRGIDPRGFTLVAFGGAGPMHAARVAERFGISRVLVPAHSGVASAAGLLTGALSTERVVSRLDAADPDALFDELAHTAAADLGLLLTTPGLELTRSADVRFRGQSHDLTVPWSPAREELASRFFTKYTQVYGIAQQSDVEVVAYRLRLTLPPPSAGTAKTGVTPTAEETSTTTRAAYFGGAYVEVPVHTRDTLERLHGPAVIEDPESTIIVPPGWTASLDEAHAVHVIRESGP